MSFEAIAWCGGDGAAHQGSLPRTRSIGTTPIGVRQIDGIDPIKLRLFFLSLLWRAAATTREEFSEVVLAGDELERLRFMIVTGRIDPLSFYPCQLTQLSTKGIIHNHAPRKDAKYVPDLEGDQTESLELPTYRFYFDGLIVHMRINMPSQYSADRLGNLIVGADESLMLSTVTFEGSLQYMNMRAVIEEHGIQ